MLRNKPCPTIDKDANSIAAEHLRHDRTRLPSDEALSGRAALEGNLTHVLAAWQNDSMTSPFYPGRGSSSHPRGSRRARGYDAVPPTGNVANAMSPTPDAPPPSFFQVAIGIVGNAILGLGAIWVIFGHIILAGGMGGWMMIVGFFFFLPIYLIVLGIHMVLSRLYMHTVGTKAAGLLASPLILIMDLLVIVYPAFVQDFGDSGPGVPSRVEVWFAIPRQDAARLWNDVATVVIVMAVLLIIADVVDLVRIRRSTGPLKVQELWRNEGRRVVQSVFPLARFFTQRDSSQPYSDISDQQYPGPHDPQNSIGPGPFHVP